MISNQQQLSAGAGEAQADLAGVPLSDLMAAFAGRFAALCVSRLSTPNSPDDGARGYGGE
jgi:hypothetical protein